MYQQYVDVLTERAERNLLRKKGAEKTVLQRMLSFYPSLRKKELNEVCDENIYDNEECIEDRIAEKAEAKQDFEDYENNACTDQPKKPANSSSVIFFYREVHCPAIDSTRRNLTTFVNDLAAQIEQHGAWNVSAALPPPVRLRNPCNTSAATLYLGSQKYAWNASVDIDLAAFHGQDTVELRVKADDGSCAYAGNWSVGALRPQLRFEPRSASCVGDATLTHARDFGVALGVFDASVEELRLK